MHQWVKLFTRYGSCIANPTEDQLRAAIQEVFARIDQEHPNAWIECGSDGGALHTLSISFRGSSCYTKYSDADMTDELDSVTRTGLDEEQAFRAWKTLIAHGEQ